MHVADWIELQGRQISAPTVKQQLATLRHLFDWLVTGQVVPVNPAASVRGPRHVLRSGKTAVLEKAIPWPFGVYRYLSFEEVEVKLKVDSP